MKSDIYEYTIASHWLTYLINGDASGYSKDELRQINAFALDAYTAAKGDYPAMVCAHWSYDSADEFESFKTCEVCGLKAMCVRVQYVVMLADETTN